ncbi:hypothetical protein D1R32_gp346 [Tunisvirus fontaine2]|uniref:Uncharacterized protein n=1 Tax=Tunisvirus fontaine2 TaxID=1421067 RepID=V9SDU0_9VIRU|nr:hypothetical protein D1R32_gp346 [Tunisvirus fontaine2]AHC55063.1 hypothetical protein TNS_ORF345 [Tunisvirus fontaine2]
MSTKESIQNLLCELSLHEDCKTDTPRPLPTPLILLSPKQSFYDVSPSWTKIRGVNDFSMPTRYIEELERTDIAEGVSSVSFEETIRAIKLLSSPISSPSQSRKKEPLVIVDSTNPREQSEWEENYGETKDKEFWEKAAKLWDEID